MTDVPEIPKDTTLEPILHERRRPVIDDKPVEVPAMMNSKASIVEKIALPARSSLLWTGVRHFMYGAIAGGSAAWASVAGVFKLLGLTGTAAVGASLASPFGYLILGSAVIVGVCDAIRKVSKEKSGGKDWTDNIYLILEFLVKLITQWQAKKGGAKNEHSN